MRRQIPWSDVRSFLVGYYLAPVLGGLGAIAASLYGGVQKVAGPMTPLVLGYLFVFIFTVILVLINLTEEIRDRRERRRLSNRTPQEIKTDVRDWLMRNGFAPGRLW